MSVGHLYGQKNRSLNVILIELGYQLFSSLSMKSLAGKVAVVTGASRGIGKGIALQLAEAGATVYITGRTLTPKKDDAVGGSLTETAAEVEKRGGKCIPAQCDHGKDEDVKKLFERVKQEQDGQLDVLVNNAYSGVNAIAENSGVPFWEQDLSMWDTVNNVGLSLPFQKSLPVFCVCLAADGSPKTRPNHQYIICRRHDLFHECPIWSWKRSNVSLPMAAILPRWCKILVTRSLTHSFPDSFLKNALSAAETTEYAGKCVVSLASDPNIMKKTGRIFISRDLGDEYGFVDINGRVPPNIRSVSYIVSMTAPRVAAFIPNFLKVPFWVMSLFASKF